MKFYYIDDSMFQDSEFAQVVRYRFEKKLEQNKVQMILISASDAKNKSLCEFVQNWRAHNVTIIVSPALFEVDGIRGNLRTTYAAIENYPPLQSYSGTCVEYDIEHKIPKRIYLDLFTHYDDEAGFDTLIEELEEMIQNRISGIDKKPYH